MINNIENIPVAKEYLNKGIKNMISILFGKAGFNFNKVLLTSESFRGYVDSNVNKLTVRALQVNDTQRLPGFIIEEIDKSCPEILEIFNSDIYKKEMFTIEPIDDNRENELWKETMVNLAMGQLLLEFNISPEDNIVDYLKNELSNFNTTEVANKFISGVRESQDPFEDRVLKSLPKTSKEKNEELKRFFKGDNDWAK